MNWYYHIYVTSSDVIDLLVDHGTDINALSKHNNSALIISIDEGKLFENFYANTKTTRAEMQTWFSYIGFDRGAHFLITRRADVNIVGKYGTTALIQAAAKGTEMRNSLFSY